MGTASDVLSYATFEADFPEEEVVVDEHGAETPTGHAIAEHLRSRLAEHGLAVSTVSQHSFYGWAFDVRIGPVTIWCMLQFSEPWLLITDVPGRFLDRVRRRSPDERHRTVLDILGRLLASDPFRNASWTTRAGYESRAELRPADRG